MLSSLNPINKVNQRRQLLDSSYVRLQNLMQNKLDRNKELIVKCSTNLESLSPLSILSRGYSIAFYGGTQNIVSDNSQVEKGQNIDIMVKNGLINCIVENVSGEDKSLEKRKRIK
jgi:exodeoxyribonuclease VII large subunit